MTSGGQSTVFIIFQAFKRGIVIQDLIGSADIKSDYCFSAFDTDIGYATEIEQIVVFTEK